MFRYPCPLKGGVHLWEAINLCGIIDVSPGTKKGVCLQKVFAYGWCPQGKVGLYEIWEEMKKKNRSEIIGKVRVLPKCKE